MNNGENQFISIQFQDKKKHLTSRQLQLKLQKL